MATKKKIVVGATPNGPLVIRKRVRHWITGEWIYPVRAKALAFVPTKPKKK